MDDYDSGLHRGRATRHALGRLRWLLVISLFGNVFLLYKHWDYHSQLSEQETMNELMRKSVAEKNLKESKTEEFISALHKEKEKCNKYLSDTKELLSECEGGRKRCVENLADTSSQLKNKADGVNQLEKEKGEVNTDLEKCKEDLVAARELNQQQNTDIAEMKKKNEALASEKADHQAIVNEKEADTQDIKQGKKSVGPIQEIEVPDVVGSQPGDAEVAPEEAGKKTEEENKEPVGLSTLTSCLFNEELKGQKCLYRNEPVIPRWKLGHAEFLSSADADPDVKDVLCIFIDDSIVSSKSFTSIVFDEFKTDHCVEVALTLTVTESGFIIVEDGEQTHEFGFIGDSSGWRAEKFVFKQSPSHVVKIIGKVQSEGGGAAIARITLTEAKCLDADDHELKDASDDTEELGQII